MSDSKLTKEDVIKTLKELHSRLAEIEKNLAEMKEKDLRFMALSKKQDDIKDSITALEDFLDEGGSDAAEEDFAGNDWLL